MLIQDAFQRDPEALREMAVGGPARLLHSGMSSAVNSATKQLVGGGCCRSRALHAWRWHPRSCSLPEAFLVQIATNGCLLAALSFSPQSFTCVVFERWLAWIFATEVMFALTMFGAHWRSDRSLPLARVVQPSASWAERLRFNTLMVVRLLLAVWRCWWWLCGVLAVREVSWRDHSPLVFDLFLVRLLLWPLAAARLSLACRQAQEERLRGAAASIVLRVPRSVAEVPTVQQGSSFCREMAAAWKRGP